MTSDDEAHDIVALMHDLADASADAIMPYFRTAVAIEEKTSDRQFDPVTAADRAGELAMRELIRQRFPRHGIVGEEYGTHAGSDDLVWILDPIDGTKAFILGLPTWGTLIGFEKSGVSTMGMMSQPFTGERFWSDGTTSRFKLRNEAAAPLRASVAEKPLADIHMAATHPDIFAAGDEQRAFAAINAATKSCRFGTDCYAYCLLAAGHIDLVVEAGLQPYDVAALIPIVENAGGTITTWDGGPARTGGRIIAAANATLHAAASSVITDSIG